MLDPHWHIHAPDLITWLERNGASLFLSVMTITEMDAGALKLRRVDATSLLVTAILSGFQDRVLVMDVEVVRHVARLGEFTHQQPVALPDLIIAATASRHGLTVLTRNKSDFGRLGVQARDPIASLPLDI